jgi:hypothetical protein
VYLNPLAAAIGEQLDPVAEPALELGFDPVVRGAEVSEQFLRIRVGGLLQLVVEGADVRVDRVAGGRGPVLLLRLGDGDGDDGPGLVRLLLLGRRLLFLFLARRLGGQPGDGECHGEGGE